MERGGELHYISHEGASPGTQESEMPRLVRTTKAIVLAIAAATALAGSARAFSTDPLNRGERTRMIINGRQLDVQALDRIQGRRDFQRQQQQFREQDRPLVRPQRLEVPRMKQSCRQRLFGTKFRTGCD